MNRSERLNSSIQRDIFISHSASDYDKAKVIQAHLKQEGYSCWIAPDDVQPDALWARQIVAAIHGSKVLLIVLSSRANDSLNVSREVALAADKVPMLTARIEDVRPDGALQYFLTLIHWIDIFPGPVDPHLAKVKNALSLLLSDEGARSQAASVSRTLQGHTAAVTSLAFSPDGKYLVSGSRDGTIRMWEVRHLREIAMLGPEGSPVNGVSYSPDGGQLISAANDGVHIWDTTRMAELATLKGHARPVNACAFSPDGQKIVSASDDAALKLWDAEDGREILTLKGHTGSVRACAFSSDGSRIVSAGGSLDRTLKLWDAETGQEISTLRGHTDGVPACAFSPDGRHIVSASESLRLWDTETGREAAAFRGRTGRVNSCVFSPDGKLILSVGGDGLLKLWSRECEELASYAGHSTPINTCAFSPDGRIIASSGEDAVIRILGGQ
jgi:WD40 repeat protein